MGTNEKAFDSWKMKRIIFSFLLSFLIVLLLFLLNTKGTKVSDFLYLPVILISVPILFMIFAKHPPILIILCLAFSIPVVLFWLGTKVKNRYLSILFSMLSGGLCGVYVFGSFYIVGHGG